MISLLLAAALPVASTNDLVKMSADKAYYDRDGGFACFSGKVFVDDVDYKLHSNRAYVFTEGTNGLKRVVALGDVALTNGTRRAYGEKATYYRNSGLVVLCAGEDRPAEVMDGAGDAARTLRGKKIRFWTRSHQIEVEEAWLSGTREGAGASDLRDVLRR